MCTYLSNLSMRADELTFGNSDRYDSFNKLENELFTESYSLIFKLSFIVSRMFFKTIC